jgi:hypothetical protein
VKLRVFDNIRVQVSPFAPTHSQTTLRHSQVECFNFAKHGENGNNSGKVLLLRDEK